MIQVLLECPRIHIRDHIIKSILSTFLLLFVYLLLTFIKHLLQISEMPGEGPTDPKFEGIMKNLTTMAETLTALEEKYHKQSIDQVNIGFVILFIIR